MNREAHIEWAKQRALAELDAGGPGSSADAHASLNSDLGKHPDTSGHQAIVELGMMLALGVHLQTPRKIREFIEGIQ